jgi:hypothetical protein
MVRIENPIVPNAETIEAMKAARRGDLIVAGPPDELLKSLNGSSSSAEKSGPSS